MDNSILVLGGAGFIGSHIAEEFSKSGFDVTILDSLSAYAGGSLENISSFSKKIKFIKGDIATYDGMNQLIDDSSIIIDSMGLTRHSLGMDNPIIDLQHNLLPQLSLIQHLKGKTGKSVLYLGSRSQYGRPEEGGNHVTETTKFNPLDPQGIHKVAAESHYRIYSEKLCFNCTSLRVSNCFGERQPIRGDDIGLVGNFIRSAIRNEALPVFDEFTSRQFIYVKDLARIVYAIAQQKLSGFQAFNVFDENVNLAFLAHTIVDVVGGGSVTVHDNRPQYEVGTIAMSRARIERILGDFEFSNFLNSLNLTVAYFKKSLHDLIERPGVTHYIDNKTITSTHNLP